MSEQGTCPECGTAMDPADAVYSEQGVLVCERCSISADIVKSEGRAGKSILGASSGAITLGFFAVFVANPCLLTSIFGVLTGISTFVVISRNPEIALQMGWRSPAAKLIAVIGILLSVVAPFLSLTILGSGI